MTDKNVKIEIEQDHISISHHNEEIVYWHSDEWNEDADIVISITNAVMLASSGGIMELRKLVGKPMVVGVTEITEDNVDKIRYYINNMDENGREDIVVISPNKDDIMKEWEEMKADESNYDMHLYIAIAESTLDDFEILDDEVIDSFLTEE
jgi:DNA helicase IV